MMKVFFKKRLFIAALLGLALVSCEKDEETKALYSPRGGYFVICEGGFNLASGDVTFKSGSIFTPSLFNAINEPNVLGDILQSFNMIEHTGYLVVNNSQKVVSVDMNTFKKSGEIKGLSYPRYIHKVSATKALLSNGNGFGGDKLYVIDLPTFKITDSITVGKGPETFATVGSNVYVCNSGAWADDSTLSVINASTLNVTGSVKVGVNPYDVEVDVQGNLWVYCAGNWSGVKSTIYKVTTATGKAELKYTFEGGMATYGHNLLAMSPDGKTLYVANDKIYKVDINAASFSMVEFANVNCYGISTDSYTGDVLACDATAKKCVVLDPVKGDVVTSIETGENPNSVLVIKR